MGSHGAAGEGHVLHWARGYDALVFVLTLGKERAFRKHLLDLAGVGGGESVLDVGCGTGTLAVEAKRRAGPGGQAAGIDPAPEMVARARRKAAKAGTDVRFETGSVEHLPFTDRSMDVVLSSLMLHHVTDDGRAQGMAEIARVLKPGGRFLAVDIGGGEEGKHYRLRLRAGKHAEFDLRELVPQLEGAGLEMVDQGPVGGPRVLGLPNLRFVLSRTATGS